MLKRLKALFTPLFSFSLLWADGIGTVTVVLDSGKLYSFPVPGRIVKIRYKNDETTYIKPGRKVSEPAAEKA